MVDITIPKQRSFRPDRRLIATLTSDPQLIKYLENLGLDVSEGWEDIFAKLLELIIDALENALSAQGSANRALQATGDLERLQSQQPQDGARIEALIRRIYELEQAVNSQTAPFNSAAARRLDELEQLMLGVVPQSLDSSSVIVGPASWTPILTFAVPGDLAVTYTIQMGTYTKIGREAFYNFTIVTSSFTFTTASGAIMVTGFPFPCNTPNRVVGHIDWGGITKAGYTQMSSVMSNGTTSINISGSGSGLTRSSVNSADTPSGGTIVLSGSIHCTV